jgi:hypothetical protein
VGLRASIPPPREHSSSKTDTIEGVRQRSCVDRLRTQGLGQSCGLDAGAISRPIPPRCRMGAPGRNRRFRGDLGAPKVYRYPITS